ncbi:MAG: DUF3786 domain-containing protein [Endomicrobia bacterium]|nr:DUF3786 domain-containing protein [Endomicrobiia bacterium]
MTHQAALISLWSKLKEVADKEKYEINFLNDTYEINLTTENVLSYSCNAPTPEEITILLLSYLIKKLKNEIPKLENELVTFNEIPDGKFLYQRFKERAVYPLLRKYGDNPQYLFDSLKRFKGKKSDIAEYAVEIQVFDEVKIIFVLYPKDEEFQADGNFLFDKSISKIFTTEEIEVLCIEIGKLL